MSPRKIINMVKALINVARMASADDSENYRSGQFIYLGRTVRGRVFTPYGIMHNPPANSMGVLLSQNAQSSNAIGIVDDPNRRPLKGLTEGEVAIGNYLTEATTYYKANGDIETITGDTDIKLTTSEITVTSGTVIINTGNTTVTITDGQVTIDAANLQVNGDITATGTITGETNVVSGTGGSTVTLGTHVHNFTNADGVQSTTQAPTSGT